MNNKISNDLDHVISIILVSKKFTLDEFPFLVFMSSLTKGDISDIIR